MIYSYVAHQRGKVMKLLTPIKRLEMLHKPFIFMAFISILSYGSAAFAQATTSLPNIDAAQMLVNLSNSVGSLMQLTTAISYVLGMFLVIKGIFALKEYGEHRTHGSSQQGSLKTALMLLLAGSLLIFLPSSVQTGTSTLWATTPSAIAYVTDTNDQWSQVISSVFLVVQLIGTIAFIRGIVILSHSGEGHQQGAFGRAMAHIVGGILCINMYAFITTVLNTLIYGQT
jgi:intracellular multiplication protein IcmC